jgi:hypothetical protein
MAMVASGYRDGAAAMFGGSIAYATSRKKTITSARPSTRGNAHRKLPDDPAFDVENKPPGLAVMTSDAPSKKVSLDPGARYMASNQANDSACFG